MPAIIKISKISIGCTLLLASLTSSASPTEQAKIKIDLPQILLNAGQAVPVRITNNSTIVATNIHARIPARWHVEQKMDDCTSLKPGASCQLLLTANKTVPVTSIQILGDNTNMIKARVGATARITVSPSNLTLTIGGSQGTLNVLNNSPVLTATNIHVSLPASWSDVTQDTTQCQSLAPLASCAINLTAGSAIHLPQVVVVEGSNTSEEIIVMSVNASTDTTLSGSVDHLALAVNDPDLNPALTGNARTITITNTGSNDAENVSYVVTPALPADTTISPASCGTIAVGGTCVLTIQPGGTASAAPGVLNPTPITLTIQGTNTTNTLTPQVSVLTYGSVYQQGFVFAVDDSYATHPASESIGGKLASLKNQITEGPTTGVVWESNGISGSPADVNYFQIYGVNTLSTPTTPAPALPIPNLLGYQACDGIRNGACNTNNIVIYQDNNRLAGGPPPTPHHFYAAGICKDYNVDSDGHSPCQTGVCYNNWYLPAVCEMGYGNYNCGSVSSPTLQNMQSSLVVTGVPNRDFVGAYWTSSQDPVLPDFAVIQIMDTINIYNGAGRKDAPDGIRCARAFS